MKRILLWLLVLIHCVFIMQNSALAENDNVLILPESLREIGEQAFAESSAFTTLIVPKSVERIDSKAFANCIGLKDVYFAKNVYVSIARDAFEGCSNLHFYVYPETSSELYAMSHGYSLDYLEPGSPFLDRAMNLIAANGGSTVLQSGEFSSKRLIVLRNTNKLPDISVYEPTEVIYDEDVFIIQFETVDNAADCYTMLANDPDTIFVEADESVVALEDISSQGLVDIGTWGTDDPMGFEAYANFVSENSSGSVTIAVVDSGISKLASYSNKLRSDGVNMLQAQDGQDWSTDYNRHGSVIASVISDCVGNANVSILPVRVVGASGNTDYILLGNGIKYAVKHGANIINLSMNFKESAYVTHCIDEAVAAGVTVVVAAGNQSRNISNVYPANLENVVTVSGLDHRRQLSATSNFGVGVNYCAPDSYVKTSAYSNSLFNGTSFSAPMIASALALVQMDPHHSIDNMNANCYLNDGIDNPPASFGNGMPLLDRLADIAVTSVSFDSSMPAEIAVSSVIPVTWSVLPANATNKTVSVESDDNTVLEVENSQTGAISLKALKAGTATITLTAEGSGVSVQRTFTVVQPVVSITVQGAENTLPLQRKLHLSAVINPDNATTQKIEWISTNNQVATVSLNGLVEPVSVGTVGIYARATDGYGAQSAVVSITVIEQPDADYIALSINDVDVTNGSYTMQPEDAVQLHAVVYPEGADQSVSYIAGGSYFQVSDTGVITATGKGSGATVIVMSKNDASIRSSLGINVVVPPASVSISGDNSVNEGNTITLTAEVLPENADDRSVTWSSSNNSVASVSPSGVVTGVKAGTAVITATASGDHNLSATKSIEVKHPYTINFNLNVGNDSTAIASMNSKIAFSGYEVGTLPTASRDYHTLDGWYSQANGGVKYGDSTVLDTTENEVIFYAHWNANPLSDWVLTSQVPSNARVLETSYSFRESTENTSSSLSGWTRSGEYWKQVGSGSVNWASFPDGFSRSHWIYTSFAKQNPYSAYVNNSSKRDVSNTWAGYVYWHWMYSMAYAPYCDSYVDQRAILHFEGYGRDYRGEYHNFDAWTSPNGNYSVHYDYCNSYNLPNYVIWDYTGWENTHCNYRWFRFDYYTSSYVDYDKYYTFYRDISYQVTDPGNGSNITNKVTYVKYQMK